MAGLCGRNYFSQKLRISLDPFRSFCEYLRVRSWWPDEQPEKEDDRHPRNPVAKVETDPLHSRLTGAGGAQMLSRFPEDTYSKLVGFSMPEVRDTYDIVGLRKRLGLNQAAMAHEMGLGSRAYFTLENEPEQLNARHIMLAQFVSLKLAVERGDKDLADATIAQLARNFVKL